jgi:hypothetical protein
MRRFLFGLAAVGLTIGLTHAAGNKTVTEPCTKNLATGEYNYDSSGWSEDYIIAMVSFHESKRDGRTAYGSCTITLRYQPAD